VNSQWVCWGMLCMADGVVGSRARCHCCCDASAQGAIAGAMPLHRMKVLVAWCCAVLLAPADLSGVLWCAAAAAGPRVR
jgi:hypothetical protein